MSYGKSQLGGKSIEKDASKLRVLLGSILLPSAAIPPTTPNTAVLQNMRGVSNTSTGKDGSGWVVFAASGDGVFDPSGMIADTSLSKIDLLLSGYYSVTATASIASEVGATFTGPRVFVTVHLRKAGVQQYAPSVGFINLENSVGWGGSPVIHTLVDSSLSNDIRVGYSVQGISAWSGTIYISIHKV